MLPIQYHDGRDEQVINIVSQEFFLWARTALADAPQRKNSETSSRPNLMASKRNFASACSFSLSGAQARANPRFTSQQPRSRPLEHEPNNPRPASLCMSNLLLSNDTDQKNCRPPPCPPRCPTGRSRLSWYRSG